MEIREPEVWKDIPGYEGIYQVSNWGNVRSIDRNVNHPKGGIMFKKGILLKFKVGFYNRVELNNNKKNFFSVHKLMICSFLNLKLNDATFVINHKDGNKFNNYIKNLEVCSIRENTTHYYIISNEKRLIGASYDKSRRGSKKWRSQINVNRKKINLGYFKTELDAHQAYLNALKEYGINNKYADGNQSL